MDFADTRLEKAEVVLEAVDEARIPRDAFRSVTTSTEPFAIAVIVTNGSQAIPALDLPRVEGRIDVDEIDGSVWHFREHVEALSVDHPILLQDRFTIPEA
jgi:hypothetical protein